MKRADHKPSLARLNPLNCALCKRTECTYYGTSDEMYRTGATIKFEDCAEMSGGKASNSAGVRHG